LLHDDDNDDSFVNMHGRNITSLNISHIKGRADTEDAGEQSAGRRLQKAT
jgi:hypothetical protein